MRIRREALYALGATLAAIGIALCIADGTGGHPLRKLWFLVGLGCILFGLGILLAFLVERPPTEPGHDGTLRMQLGAARAAVTNERGCPFADRDRAPVNGGSEEFWRHFSRLSRHLRPWNAATSRHYTACEQFRVKLLEECEDRLPGYPAYRSEVIAKDLDCIVLRRALNDRLEDPVSFKLDSTGEVWTGASIVAMPPHEGLRLAGDGDWSVSMLGIPVGDRYDREFETRTKPVNDLLTEALRWPIATEIRDSYRNLLAVDRQPLLNEVGKLEERPRFRRKRRCPTCRRGWSISPPPRRWSR